MGIKNNLQNKNLIFYARKKHIEKSKIYNNYKGKSVIYFLSDSSKWNTPLTIFLYKILFNCRLPPGGSRMMESRESNDMSDSYKAEDYKKVMSELQDSRF